MMSQQLRQAHAGAVLRSQARVRAGAAPRCCAAPQAACAGGGSARSARAARSVSAAPQLARRCAWRCAAASGSDAGGSEATPWLQDLSDELVIRDDALEARGCERTPRCCAAA
jgi:hypothetical protein